MSDELFELKSGIRHWLDARPGAIVLEAGCGSISHLDLSGAGRVAGIDISRAQLDRNTRLDERILGDLQSFPLPASSYDLIVSWDVLEHLEHPRAALDILFHALREDGLLVLAFPDRSSFKGFLTRFTGYGLHVLFYRLIVGDRRSAEEGFGQFPTYLRAAIEPDRLIETARQAGLEVEYAKRYEGPVQRHLRERHPWARILLNALGAISRAATAGRRDLTHSDAVVVLRRPGAGGAAGAAGAAPLERFAPAARPR